MAVDLGHVWEQALRTLPEAVSGAAQRAWLHQTRIVAFSEGTVVLAAPHHFAREQLETRYADDLRAALSDVLQQDVKVGVIVHADVQVGNGSLAVHASAVEDGDRDHDPPRRVAHGPSGLSGSDLNDKYTFERFVVGPGNRFAQAAAFAVSEAPARAYNPLFIYGGVGLGKTHLLQAVGHYAMRLYPQSKVRYVTSEGFTNEFIDAVKNGRQQHFQRRYRDVDILLIDDIQFLETRERTQEEFFHTFNQLHQDEKQIVISSDRPPKRIAQLEQRLRTRFEMGLLTDIQPPDLETRLAILRKKAEFEGLDCPYDVLELIAARIASNIRELEGALIRVSAAASLDKTPITLPMALAALKDIFPNGEGPRITAALVMNVTASYFDVTVDDLRSGTRTRALVNARQIAMYITRELTDLSLPKIGQAFGGRDHSTVIHANRKISRLIKERHSIYEQVQELTSRVKARARSSA